MALADLGISDGDERVYRYLLNSKTSSVLDVAFALGLEVAVAEAAVARLSGVGLISFEHTGLIEATEAFSTLDRLAERRVAEILHEFQRGAAQRSKQNDDDRGTEHLGSPERVAARLVEELNVNRPEVMRSSRSPGRVRAHRDATAVPHLRHGTRYRILVHRSLMDDPLAADYYHDLSRAGDTIRVTDDLLQAMTLLDRDRAFVPIVADNPYAGALLVRNPGIVSTLADVFDRAWMAATELSSKVSDEASDSDRRLLNALQQTAKDEIAAQLLGVSVRTLRRHAADLMDRLGAENRFQLAAFAKDRGWL